MSTITHPSDMPFLHCRFPNFPNLPAFIARLLQRTIKAPMQASSTVLESHIMPSVLTSRKRRPSHSCSSSSPHDSERKSPLTSAGAKCRSLSFLPSLKMRSSSASSSSTSSSSSSACPSLESTPEPVDSEASDDSPSACELITGSVPFTPVALSPISIPILLPLSPPIGTKITNCFWPEEDPVYGDTHKVSCALASPATINVLSPPPYHRRCPSSVVVVQRDDVLSSDEYSLHHHGDKDVKDSLPLQFPF